MKQTNQFVSLSARLPTPLTLGIALSLLLCSCAEMESVHGLLPADVTTNRGAGNGSWLIVMLRLESGEELPFMVDTGTADTFIDKSLEPRLGRRRGSTTFTLWNVKHSAGAYAALPLYWGSSLRIKTSSLIFSADWLPKPRVGAAIMGVLGMDCLTHYCIQLDFEAGKLRFLDPEKANIAGLGKAFPLTFKGGRPFIHHTGLLGGEDTYLLVDSGFDGDGGLESSLFREVHEQRLSEAKSAGSVAAPGWMFFREAVWDGVNYTNVTIGEGGNLIGLRFLARHLVTLNFPKRTMYLKLRDPSSPRSEVAPGTG